MESGLRAENFFKKKEALSKNFYFSKKCMNEIDDTQKKGTVDSLRQFLKNRFYGLWFLERQFGSEEVYN